MITEADRRLAEFVDRDHEMKRFENLLDTSEKLVMVVAGPGGIGKSSLMARMRHHCANKKTKFVEIIYTDDDIPEYIAIMRRCRDNLATRPFEPLTDLINYYTVPQYTLKVELHGGNVSVGQVMTMTDSSVGTMAGVVIKDSMISFPRSDLDVSESERRMRLTQTFLVNLAEAARAYPQLVIFIDAAEKMSETTARWLWTAFIPGIVDGGIANIRFVILTRAKPELDRWKRQLVDETELAPLTIPDIVMYMEKREVAAEHREALAQMVFAISRGNPLDIANHVDSFLELQYKQGKK
jgi:archaellum biogenesis ATPase FlaH